jgi:hypothetical protein
MFTCLICVAMRAMVFAQNYDKTDVPIRFVGIPKTIIMWQFAMRKKAFWFMI